VAEEENANLFSEVLKIIKWYVVKTTTAAHYTKSEKWVIICLRKLKFGKLCIA
jgi:hypothetical protein